MRGHDGCGMRMGARTSSDYRRTGRRTRRRSTIDWDLGIHGQLRCECKPAVGVVSEHGQRRQRPRYLRRYLRVI